MNDDMATLAVNDNTNGSNSSSSSGGAGTTSSLHSLLSGGKNVVALTAEECMRRVEDIARLH